MFPPDFSSLAAAQSHPFGVALTNVIDRQKWRYSLPHLTIMEQMVPIVPLFPHAIFVCCRRNVQMVIKRAVANHTIGQIYDNSQFNFGTAQPITSALRQPSDPIMTAIAVPPYRALLRAAA